MSDKVEPCPSEQMRTALNKILAVLRDMPNMQGNEYRDLGLEANRAVNLPACPRAAPKVEEKACAQCQFVRHGDDCGFCGKKNPNPRKPMFDEPVLSEVEKAEAEVIEAAKKVSELHNHHVCDQCRLLRNALARLAAAEAKL